MARNNEKPEIIYKDVMVPRSNFLVSAKYKSTLMENKMVLLAIKKAKVDERGLATAVISTEELKNLFGRDDGGIYEQLKQTVKDIGGGRYIFMEDPKTKRFVFINLIDSAVYENGTLAIRFTSGITEHIAGLQNNFTTMNIGILVRFTSNYAYRIYELMKIHAYKLKEEQRIRLEYGLSELKLSVGCVNIQEHDVRKELEKASPDFDYIVNHLALEKHFMEWTEFRRNVLDVATKQINERSDLYISFEPLRSGRGGKVIGVRFYLEANPNNDANELVDPLEQQEMLIKQVRERIPVDLTDSNVMALLKVADNDLDKIFAAYELSLKQEEIKNFVGWMTAAIKKGYQDEEEIPMLHGSVDRAKFAKEMREEYTNNKSATAKSVWSKIKDKEDFEKFLETCNFGMSFSDVNDLEIIYTAEELTKMYLDWRKEHFSAF